MSDIWFLIIPVALFIYQQFPSNWSAWGIAFLLSAPAYVYLVSKIIDPPEGDMHGYGMMMFGYAILPIVGGNLVRALVLWQATRGADFRARSIYTILGFITLAMTVYFVPSILIEPYNRAGLSEKVDIE